VLTKILRAISGSPEKTDWESMLTHVGGDSSVWSDSDVVRQNGINQHRLVAAPDLHAPDVNLALLGLAGDEVHARAKAIAKDLHALAERGATVQQWNLLLRDVTALSEMGQTINSLAEVKLRRVKPQVQSIQMLPLMGSVLAKRANDLRRSGVLLVPQLQSCTVESDPNLCKALVESAIEWAMPFGNRLTVSTELSAWGSAARLSVMADHVVKTKEDVPTLERTSHFVWEMITELAQAASVIVSRSQVDGKTAICLEFPAHSEHEGVASKDLNLLTMDSQQLAQLDVLVYATSPLVKMSVEKTLGKAQSRVRHAASSMHLVRECEMALPAALIIESELLDETAKSLIDDVRRHVRNFAMVEIVKAPNVYDVSLPGSNNPCRLSVANIDSNLRDALTFELAQG
jgi:hypothetical protein